MAQSAELHLWRAVLFVGLRAKDADVWVGTADFQLVCALSELLSNLVFWDRHAAARSGVDGLTPLMKSTPSMTSARWAKPRSLRQLVSAH